MRRSSYDYFIIFPNYAQCCLFSVSFPSTHFTETAVNKPGHSWTVLQVFFNFSLCFLSASLTIIQ